MSEGTKSNKRGLNRSNNLIRHSVHVAVLAALAAASAAAQAQQAPASSGEQIQEVIVTGSLIKRTDAETAEAVTIIKADDLKTQGITTTEQLVAQIMSNQTATAVTTANSVTTWTGGGSFASLRGLGSSRTLVLLDGQRLASNVIYGAGIDLNTIPASAIESVEVLREGASSLYGSDAIAGVVNIITKKNYDQGEFSVNFDRPQRSGGGSGDVQITFGKGNLATDGYNFLISGSYSKQQELTATHRSFSATGYDAARGLDNNNGFFGPTPGAFMDNNGSWYGEGYPACPGNPYPLTQDGYCGYGYSSAVDLIPRTNLASALASFSKTLPGNNTLSVQYYWANSKSITWGGPMEYVEGMSGTSLYYPTGAGAQYIAAGGGPGGAPALDGSDILVGWTDATNNRYNSTNNTEQRALVTFGGDNAGWSYEIDFNYSQNRNEQSVSGYPNLDVIAPDGVVSDLINPFGPQSAAGQALINSAYLPGPIGEGLLKFEALTGHVSHDLGDAFNAGRPAALAVGFDIHAEQIRYSTTPLAAILQGATAFPPESVNGSQNDAAAYIELNVPVSHSLEFTVSDRQDRYNDFGTTNNAKVSFRYQPLDILTFRGAASTGFRAPNLVDLFSPQVLGATVNMVGPPDQCAATSGPFANGNCLLQGISVTGGNPNLTAEKSQNFDFGFVVEPIRNLGVTVDYYRVNVSNAIGTVPGAAIYANPSIFSANYVLNNQGTLTPANNIANACTNSATTSGSVILPPATCGYIIRLLQNSGGVKTSGVDLSAKYTMRTDAGDFRLGYDSTFVTEFRRQSYQGGAFVNVVGWFNQGYEPVLRYQHNINLDWTLGKFGAGLTNTLQSRYIDDHPDGNGNSRNVATYYLFNGYVSVKPVDDLTVVFGIRNILDKNPSFSNQTADWQSGYNPSLADPLGRNFYLQVKYDFNLFKH